MRSCVRYFDNSGREIVPLEQQRRNELWVALYSLFGAEREIRWAVSEAGS